jgi:hypothetical protein
MPIDDQRVREQLGTPANRRATEGRMMAEPGDLMNRTRALACLVAVSLVAGACVKKPVTAPQAVVPPTAPSELRAASTVGQRFGHMLAIGVGVSNGSTADYVITADRVLAVDAAGHRIAPLSVTEAARQAGGATALAAGLQGAGGGGLLAGLLGAIPGALIGAARGGGRGAAEGAAVGAGVGIVVGAVAGFYESKTKTEREIMAQLGDLYLGAKTAKPGLPVSGFVFFPEGQYTGVYVIAVEQPSGLVREIHGPAVPRPGARAG